MQKKELPRRNKRYIIVNQEKGTVVAIVRAKGIGEFKAKARLNRVEGDKWDEAFGEDLAMSRAELLRLGVVKGKARIAVRKAEKALQRAQDNLKEVEAEHNKVKTHICKLLGQDPTIVRDYSPKLAKNVAG